MGGQRIEKLLKSGNRSRRELGSPLCCSRASTLLESSRAGFSCRRKEHGQRVRGPDGLQLRQEGPGCGPGRLVVKLDAASQALCPWDGSSPGDICHLSHHLNFPAETLVKLGQWVPVTSSGDPVKVCLGSTALCQGRCILMVAQ